jgi:hypothetical protein
MWSRDCDHNLGATWTENKLEHLVRAHTVTMALAGKDEQISSPIVESLDKRASRCLQAAISIVSTGAFKIAIL